MADGRVREGSCNAYAEKASVQSSTNCERKSAYTRPLIEHQVKRDCKVSRLVIVQKLLLQINDYFRLQTQKMTLHLVSVRQPSHDSGRTTCHLVSITCELGTVSSHEKSASESVW